jgi:rare lipoprotein A
MQRHRSHTHRSSAIHAPGRISSVFSERLWLTGLIIASAINNGCQHAIAAPGQTEPKKASHSKEFVGLADYYHHSLYGQRTASGQVLKKDLLTAAHRTLPFGTRVHVRNKRTGKSCVVVINDRGPYVKTKVIDLSHAAASQLGLLQAGTADVACTVLKDGEILPGKKAVDIDAAAPTSEED